MIGMRTALAATGLAVAASVCALTPAAAESVDNEWWWSTPGSHGNVGYGSYDDETGVLRVDDREKDGMSLYVLVDGPDWGDGTRYYDSRGAEGPGRYTSLYYKFDKGDYVEVYLCRVDRETGDHDKCSEMQEGFTV